MENVWIALIEGGLTFLGIWVTVRASQKKANQELLQKINTLVLIVMVVKNKKGSVIYR